MISTSLERVAALVVHRAQRQGFITPREVRDELTQAGLSALLWRDVVALARPALRYRQGRYHYRTPVSARVREEQAHLRGIQRAVRQIIRRYRTAASGVERRGEDRIDFVQPVKVTTEDRRKFTLLTRDLSATGVRLVGTQRLLGQKVRVTIPAPDGSTSWDFLVRILWTCPVGEDLVENGGTFIGLGAGDV
jgi:hypothetical protein